MAAHNVDLSERVIAAAIAVHSALGPGLFESIYERALRLELELMGVPVREQVEVPVFYKGRALGTAMRLGSAGRRTPDRGNQVGLAPRRSAPATGHYLSASDEA